MSEFQPLIDLLFIEQVGRARASDVEQRFLDSLERWCDAHGTRERTGDTAFSSAGDLSTA